MNKRLFLYADFADPHEGNSVLSLYGVKDGILTIMDSQFVRGRFHAERCDSIAFILGYWAEHFNAPITKETITTIKRMKTKEDRIMRLREIASKNNLQI